ncbi:hypothetical protein NL676_014004 [Syzygium grande]|nr:hypothetical protein NL676_014004 [Syzygium grande]
MVVEQGEEEENPIEIDSDSESDSSASDLDWAPQGHLEVEPGGLFGRVPFCVSVVYPATGSLLMSKVDLTLAA